MRGAVRRDHLDRTRWRLPVARRRRCSSSAPIVVGGIYPALVQSLQGQAVGEVARGAVHRPQHQRDPGGVRPGRRVDDPVQGERRPRRRGQLRDDADDDPGRPAHRPDVVAPTFKQLQAVKCATTSSPTCSTSTATRSTARRSDAVDRGARARPRRRARRPAQLAQRPHRLHPRLRRRRRLRQPAQRRRRARSSSSRTSRRRARSGTYEPRIYFGEPSPDYSIVGGPQGRPAARVRLPAAQRDRRSRTTPYTGNGGVAIGVVVRQARLRDQVPRAELPALGRRQRRSRGILDHRTPRERVERVAPWLTLDGNAYPAVVDGPGAVDRRRLHDLGQLPHTPGCTSIDGVDLRLARPRARTVGQRDRGRPGQLHPQLGQGHRRRLRRRRCTLYAWDEPGPDAQGLDGGVPRHGRSRCRRSAAT